MAGDSTLALLYLLQRICIRKGAGLDNLKKPRRWSSIDEEGEETQP
jgi:hypothetical protein